VKFPVVRAVEPTGARTDLLGAQVIIWTTTPWTMPSEPAVCFGPDLSYGLYEITGRPEECWARIGDRYLIWPTRWPRRCWAARLTPDPCTGVCAM
jgi:isoleucyl-tRNA synthetase